jgi:hypothetical protein
VTLLHSNPIALLKTSLLASALVLSIAMLAMAQGTVKSRSGQYEELLIGTDPQTGVITGYYESATGWDEKAKSPRFVCSFYLHGEMQGDSAKIVTWWPGDDAEDSINGDLTFKADGSVSVRLESEHGGCWNVNHFADKDNPSNHTLDKAGSWTSVRLVKVRRAYFYNKPNEQNKRRAYLTKSNVIRVFNQSPGWVFAEYGDERISKGWVKESDLYDVKPPSKKN